MKNNHKLNDTILRAYDIRGIVGETLNAEDAFYIGKAFATYVIRNLHARDEVRIAAAFDGRLSSPELEGAIVRGMKSTGATVVRIGLGPTPMLYFAVRKLELDAGVMVTGSHNPPAHNGFKFMVGKLALYGEDIQKLGILSENGDVISGDGKEIKSDIFDDYIDVLEEGYTEEKNLTIAWDSGSGAAGEVMSRITSRLAGEHILLNEEIDGTFPAHHPDPSEPENLEQLISSVKKNECDIGIAFDGDGDRVGAVDNRGRIVTGDQLMMLYARDVLENNQGATIIADVKASQMLFDEIENLGGKPLIWKTGHSFIKAKMAETGAVLAGEMSGHIFFADKYYGYDDGLYAAIRLLNLVAKSDKSLSDMIDDLPTICSTPEIRIEVSEEKKFVVVEEVKKRLKTSGINFSDIDGVRVMYDDGWWLLRASNTQAAMVARCEASNQNSLNIMKKNLKEQLSLSGIEING